MYPLDEGPKSGTPEHGDGSGVDEEETRLREMLSTQEWKEGDDDVVSLICPGRKSCLDH